MKTVDASHGAVVLGILPIATAFVAVIITHERPKPLFWIASLVGAALVVGFSMRQSGGSLSVGDLLMFGSVASSAVGYAYSGRLTAHHAGMGSDQLGAGGGAADLAARGRTDPAGGYRPYRAEAMAGVIVRCAVFAMDRILCVECRDGDGRHHARLASTVAAALRHVCASRPTSTTRRLRRKYCCLRPRSLPPWRSARAPGFASHRPTRFEAQAQN